MRLSKRQVQILNLLIEGKQNKEIAYDLGISIGTVKTYLYRLYRNIGLGTVRSRTQAAVWWIKERPWHYAENNIPDDFVADVAERAAAAR